MKKLRIIAMLILITGFLSCENDGGTSNIELVEGAVTDIQMSQEHPAFLNLLALNEGEEVEIGFTVDVAIGEVTSVDLVGFYKSGNDIYGPVDLKTGITEFPAEITLTSGEIVAAFAELDSPEDIELGDELILSTRMYLSDGRVLDLLDDDGTALYGTNVATRLQFNAKVSYFVSCPSSLAGTYNVQSTGTSTEPGIPPVNNFPYTVTLTDNGGGSYTISDGVAGVYIEWYSVFGYTFETAGNFTDICGELSGTWTEGFGCEIEWEGVVNEDGTLTVHWENCFGDSVDAIYTPQ